MKKIIFWIIIMNTVPISLNWGQIAPVEKGLQAISTHVIKAQLGFLASDWTEGRKAGEKGEFLSSDYIASILQLYGVKPGGDIIHAGNPSKNEMIGERSYFQNFVLLKTVAGDEQILKVKSTEDKMIKTTDLTYKVDFILRPSNQGMEIEAPVVFVGYGFKNEKLKYNDFIKTDVKGKFVLKISRIPKFARGALTISEIESSTREVETTLKSMGAIGIIEFNPESMVVGFPDIPEFINMSPAEGDPRFGRPSASYTIPGKSTNDNLVRIVVSVKTANEILKGTGIDIDDYIKKADANEVFAGPTLTGKYLYLKTTVKTTQVAVRNVIGVIEGNNPIRSSFWEHITIIWAWKTDTSGMGLTIMARVRLVL